MSSARRSAVHGLVGLLVTASLVGWSAPAARTAHQAPARVVLTGHAATVVAKHQAKGFPLGSVSVTGKVTPAGTGRVVLQRHVGKTWQDVGRATLTRKATFAVRGTRLPVGRLAMRVVVVEAHTAAMVSAAFSLLVKAPVLVKAFPQPPAASGPAAPVPPPQTPVAPLVNPIRRSRQRATPHCRETPKPLPCRGSTLRWATSAATSSRPSTSMTPTRTTQSRRCRPCRKASPLPTAPSPECLPAQGSSASRHR